MAVGHILAAIKLQNICVRLQSDMELAHKDLRKDFLRFMGHALDLSEAFEKVDAGPAVKSKGTKNRSGQNCTGGSSSSDKRCSNAN